MEKDETSGGCGMHGGDKKCIHSFGQKMSLLGRT